MICSQRGIRLRIVAIFLSAVAFCLPHAAAAGGGTLYLSEKAVYVDPDSVPFSVRKECDLESKIILFTEKNSETYFSRIIRHPEVSASTPGKALSIRITSVTGVDNKALAGPKKVVIEGTLWENGSLKGSFTAGRTAVGGASWGGYTGACGLLARCATALGKDVSLWLKKPTMNAKLGDQR